MRTDIFVNATNYVVGDQHFWLSMALTSMISMYVGSVVYNGDLKEIKKGLVAVGAYAGILAITNAWRIIPSLANLPSEVSHLPLAGIITLTFVSIFYIFGMFLGVSITKYAHNNKREVSKL